MMRKRLIAVLLFGVAGAWGWTGGVAQTAPAQAGASSGAAAKTVMVIAHRGEHMHHPENTLAAIEAAIGIGADYVELDVRTTADGKLVLMHDKTVDRTTNGTGAVSDLTLAQMRALDAGVKTGPEFKGTRVPTFDEALKLAQGKIKIYVDTKEADAQLLVDTIARYGMQDQVVIYANPFFLHDVEKILPSLRVMPEAESVDVCRLEVRGLKPRVIAFEASDFKPEVLACAEDAKALIFVDRLWEADTPADWQKAVDMGADAIQTNYPAELVAYLRAHGLRAR
jgi:glycerophosphoryl diester phosphodiesterase